MLVKWYFSIHFIRLFLYTRFQKLDKEDLPCDGNPSIYWETLPLMSRCQTSVQCAQMELSFYLSVYQGCRKDETFNQVPHLSLVSFLRFTISFYSLCVVHWQLTVSLYLYYFQMFNSLFRECKFVITYEKRNYTIIWFTGNIVPNPPSWYWKTRRGHLNRQLNLW